MIISICSSIDFTPEILETKKELERRGHKVNLPYFTQLIANGQASYEEYMEAKERDGGDILLRESKNVDFLGRYWNLIKGSDAVLVVNLRKKGIDNYIGGNTLIEMAFAHVLGKKIFLFNPIPHRNERMHYVDEIMDMKPVVLDGNLDGMDRLTPQAL